MVSRSSVNIVDATLRQRQAVRRSVSNNIIARRTSCPACSELEATTLGDLFEAIAKLEEVVSDEGMDSNLMAIDSYSNQGKSAHQN
jgi:uncharacterized protein YqgV (UPF0045/DUF77 family)